MPKKKTQADAVTYVAMARHCQCACCKKHLQVVQALASSTESGRKRLARYSKTKALRPMGGIAAQRREKDTLISISEELFTQDGNESSDK
jgi:hypothetical protein